jgi:hypothetical protein
MEGDNVKRAGQVSNDVAPAGFDAFRRASSAYEDALAAYEAAIGSGDPARRKAARELLHQALHEVSKAEDSLGTVGVAGPGQAEAAKTNVAPVPSFADLLNDPHQQLDSFGEVMASIVAYRAALPSASSPVAPTASHAPLGYLSGVYVSQQLVSSTVAATA